jgi:hypothetical protein
MVKSKDKGFKGGMRENLGWGSKSFSLVGKDRG